MGKIKTTLDLMKLGKGVKILRGSETQTSFSDRFRLPKGQLSHIENGKRRPTINFLWELHIEKKVPFEFILSGGKFPHISKQKLEEKICLMETKTCLREIKKRIEHLFENL